MPKVENSQGISSVSPFAYDPQRDLAPVDQFGFIDLHDAYVNHCVPGDIAVNVEDYNGVDDPASLIGKSQDVFEALRKAGYVKSAESSVAAAKAAAASSAATE